MTRAKRDAIDSLSEEPWAVEKCYRTSRINLNTFSFRRKSKATIISSVILQALGALTILWFCSEVKLNWIFIISLCLLNGTEEFASWACSQVQGNKIRKHLDQRNFRWDAVCILRSFAHLRLWFHVLKMFYSLELFKFRGWCEKNLQCFQFNCLMSK